MMQHLHDGKIVCLCC